MKSGFTIVEILVVMVVISLLSLFSVRAYPQARAAQKLVLAEQQLQALLREAQQKAINEERDPACVAKSTNATLERRCSDIGLQLRSQATQQGFIMFSDRNNNNQYDDPTPAVPGSGDPVLKRIDFPVGIAVKPRGSAAPASTATTFIFKGAPPTIELFTNSPPIHQPKTTPETVVFTAGKSQVELLVNSYGQVEKK